MWAATGTGGFSGASAWAFFGSLSLVAAGIIMFSAAGEVNAAPAPAIGLMPVGHTEADDADMDRHNSKGTRNGDVLERGGELQQLWAGPDSRTAG